MHIVINVDQQHLPHISFLLEQPYYYLPFLAYVYQVIFPLL
jgi:hypothetical protein